MLGKYIGELVSEVPSFETFQISFHDDHSVAVLVHSSHSWRTDSLPSHVVPIRACIVLPNPHPSL